MKDNVAFISELVTAVPQLEDLLSRHIAEHGELLPHVYMGDVSRFAIQQHRESTESSTNLRAVLNMLFTILERGAAQGSENVQDLVTASFLENVAEEMTSSTDLQSYLGPVLKRKLRLVIDTYGYE
jgi:hypothetical protein